MTFLIGAVVLTAAVLAGGDSTGSGKSEDRVICKKDRSFNTGSHMRSPAICKLKSEWVLEEKDAQRELQSVREKGVRPQPAMPTAGGGPN